MNNKLVYNKIFSIVPGIAAAMFVVATIFSMSTFHIVSTFAQSEEGANQTMKIAGQSANQTGEGVQQGASDVASGASQSANQTGEDIQKGASDVGSKITEGAKDIVGSIGEKLQELAK